MASLKALKFFYIWLFLILFLFCATTAFALEIVTINIDKKEENILWPWQERRSLAQIIQLLSQAKAKAIVLTLPTSSFTSPGADRQFLHTLSQAGNVYLAQPVLPSALNFAKASGHVYYKIEKGQVFIPQTYQGLISLVSLLAKDLGKDKKGDLRFRYSKNYPTKDYFLKDVLGDASGLDLKEKICFVGDSETNFIQAQALCNILFCEKDTEKRIILGYFLLIFLGILSFLIIYYVRNHAAVLYFRTQQGLVKIPKESGRLSFGVSQFFSKNPYTLFLFKQWPEGHLWMCMGDFYSQRQKESAYLKTIEAIFSQLNEGFGPREILLRLNTELCKIKDNSFANLIHLDIQSYKGTLSFANAGFESPILFKNQSKEFRDFSDIGIPLGLKQDFLLIEQELVLEKEDILFLFNSGLVKSRNRQGELIDIEQLKFLITQNSSLPSQQLAEKVLKTILDFNFVKPGLDIFFLVLKNRGRFPMTQLIEL